MGNSLPLPCMCREAKVVVATGGGAKKTKKRPAAKNAVVVRGRSRAAPRHAIVVPVDTAPDQEYRGEEEMKQAWPGCRVEPAVGEDPGVRVKVVMTRKDAAELLARMEERAAAEGKSRVGDLDSELGGGNGVMSPCRDAWRPRLASIPEN